MPSEAGKRLLRRMAALAAILLLMACGEDRLAGTSTSVGDTMDAVAVLSDGRGAAGARIFVRAHEIIFLDGRPEGRLLDSSRADSQGRFLLDKDLADGGWYLEIIHPEEVYLAYQKNAAAGREFRLSKPGALNVKVHWKALSDSTAWIGLRGSSRFVQARKPASGSISAVLMEGLGPGAHEVVDFGKDPSSGRIGLARIRAGQTTNYSVSAE